jgi:hypothetical protein
MKPLLFITLLALGPALAEQLPIAPPGVAAAELAALGPASQPLAARGDALALTPSQARAAGLCGRGS